MNKFTKIAMAGILAAGLAACSKPAAPVEEPTEAPETTETTPVEEPEMLGAWEKVTEKEITPELKAMFEKVFGTDYGFEPAELIAKQPVAGVNYLIRCINEAGEETFVGIYEDLNGDVFALSPDMIPEEFGGTMVGAFRAALGQEAEAEPAKNSEEQPVEEKEVDRPAETEETEADQEN